MGSQPSRANRSSGIRANDDVLRAGRRRRCLLRLVLERRSPDAAAKDVAAARRRSGWRTIDAPASADPLRSGVDRSHARAARLWRAACLRLRAERACLRRTQLLLGDHRSGPAIPARPHRRNAGRQRRNQGEAMTVLTGAKEDRADIARAFADPARLVVVSFCAAWCDTRNEFRASFERLAQARPQMAFVWLDIEDDAAFAGDVDVENFPTLAVY